MGQVKEEWKLGRNLDWLTERVGPEGIRPYELAPDTEPESPETETDAYPLERAIRAVFAALFAIIAFPFKLVFGFLFVCLQDAKVGLLTVALVAGLIYFVGPTIDWTRVELLAPFAPKPVILAQEPSAPAEATLPTEVVVTNGGADGVNLRRSPSGEVITTWPDGTVLQVIGGDISDQGRTWSHVRDPLGNEGYIATEFLVPAN